MLPTNFRRETDKLIADRLGAFSAVLIDYLGALRSRGLIKGDGDRLTIMDAESRRSARGSRFQRDLLSSTTGAAD